MGEIDFRSQSVTIDTFVMTDRGPRQVHELLGKPITLIADGKPFLTGGRGFFKSARNPVFRLETEEGFSVSLTENHLLLRVASSARSGTRAEWIDTKNVKPGDKLLLHNHRFFWNWPGEYGEAEGYLIGLLLGEGTFQQDTSAISVWIPAGGGLLVGEPAKRSRLYQKDQSESLVVPPPPNELRLSLAHVKKMAVRLTILPGERSITPTLEKCSSDFYRGFLRGLFDCDGSAQGTQKKGVSIRLSRKDVDFLQALQRMLLRLGIVGRITEEHRSEGSAPSGQDGARKSSSVKTRHELLITNNNVQYFDQLVGFANPAKQAHLKQLLTNYKRVLNRERFTVAVKGVVPGSDEDVYSVRVPGVNAFDANGFYVHNLD
ncbi:MAG TPA: LAGLIDADG family homing endonuclease [Syntrophorhabdales bacterium]|nr:LAGLIDADG family homing endonuclease [Syntrophorhabdales bacterium]